MEGKNIYLSVFPEFLELLFLFIKINHNYWFAGSESNDNVKDHELIVIDRLV